MLESCGFIKTFGKECQENTPHFQLTLFGARIEKRAVGRSCGKQLFRNVSSTELWRERFLDFALDTDTLDPKGGGGGWRAVTFKKHSQYINLVCFDNLVLAISLVMNFPSFLFPFQFPVGSKPLFLVFQSFPEEMDIPCFSLLFQDLHVL